MKITCLAPVFFLLLALIPSSQSVCCKRKGNAGCCGNGKCNIFCCNCDGGCNEVCENTHCDTATWAKCAGILAACSASCAKNPFSKLCKMCMSGMYGMCHKCYSSSVHGMLAPAGGITALNLPRLPSTGTLVWNGTYGGENKISTLGVMQKTTTGAYVNMATNIYKLPSGEETSRFEYIFIIPSADGKFVKYTGYNRMCTKTEVNVPGKLVWEDLWQKNRPNHFTFAKPLTTTTAETYKHSYVQHNTGHKAAEQWNIIVNFHVNGKFAVPVKYTHAWNNDQDHVVDYYYQPTADAFKLEDFCDDV